MLRSDFPFPLDAWPRRLAAFLLGESLLGFLAIVAVGLTLFPVLFAVPPTVHVAVDTLQWLIIAWFAVEYIVAGLLAPAKRAFLLNPWRVLDVLTILIPLTSLLPNVSGAVMSSPVLRLVRLARLVTLGVRVSGVAVRQRVSRGDEPTVPASRQIKRMGDARGISPRAASWEDLLRGLGSSQGEWFHVSNPSAEDLAEMGKAAGLAGGFLENHLLSTSYPHVATVRGGAAVFLWIPELSAAGRVQRHGMLFLLGEGRMLSLTRRSSARMERNAGAVVAARREADGVSFAVCVLQGILDAVLRQNEKLIGDFEQELRALEDVPIRESSPAFFERTFRVKQELSAAQADLWRLKGVIADLAAGHALPVDGDTAAEIFLRLTSEAEYLYETVVNLRDEVLSVLELHLNVVSFDMTRVMRVLAAVSVLGLIPAVIGGLFGMNLIDNPWPITLPQVAFCVCFGMVLCLYFFFVKGWLR